MSDHFGCQVNLESSVCCCLLSCFRLSLWLVYCSLNVVTVGSGGPSGLREPRRVHLYTRGGQSGLSRRLCVEGWLLMGMTPTGLSEGPRWEMEEWPQTRLLSQKQVGGLKFKPAAEAGILAVIQVTVGVWLAEDEDADEW